MVRLGLLNRQTDRWESLPDTASSPGSGKVMPCETEVFFCRTVRPLYSQEPSLSDTHSQIHTHIQNTDYCKMLNRWLRNIISVHELARFNSMNVWPSRLPWQISKFNLLTRAMWYGKKHRNKWGSGPLVEIINSCSKGHKVISCCKCCTVSECYAIHC